jgi:hypothetical protein
MILNIIIMHSNINALSWGGGGLSRGGGGRENSLKSKRGSPEKKFGNHWHSVWLWRMTNHTWKFQEFSTYGIGCSMIFTEFERKKNNVTETIGDQAASLIGPLTICVYLSGHLNIQKDRIFFFLFYFTNNL